MLLVLNTILLLISLCVHTTRHDVRTILQDEQIQELGGQANYDRYQKIVRSDAYREQQTFLIDQKYKSFFPDAYQYHDTTLSGQIQQ